MVVMLLLNSSRGVSVEVVSAGGAATRPGWCGVGTGRSTRGCGRRKWRW